MCFFSNQNNNVQSLHLLSYVQIFCVVFFFKIRIKILFGKLSVLCKRKKYNFQVTDLYTFCFYCYFVIDKQKFDKLISCFDISFSRAIQQN